MKQDSEIQKNVAEELAWEPSLNAAEIGVAVKDGVVTLSGSVDTYAKKMAAEAAAKRVSGVKAVAEDLEVKSSLTFKKTDTEIAHKVIDALKWNSSINDEKIQVKVDDGWVTLEGEAEWDYQRQSAKNSVQDLLGVRGITNLIKLKPRATTADIKQKINSAFHRHAFIDSEKIKVEISGNKVILTGKVRSLAEKNDAAVAAWSAPGVGQVENNIDVSYYEALSSY